MLNSAREDTAWAPLHDARTNERTSPAYVHSAACSGGVRTWMRYISAHCSSTPTACAAASIPKYTSTPIGPLRSVCVRVVRVVRVCVWVWVCVYDFLRACSACGACGACSACTAASPSSRRGREGEREAKRRRCGVCHMGYVVWRMVRRMPCVLRCMPCGVRLKCAGPRASAETAAAPAGRRSTRARDLPRLLQPVTHIPQRREG
jgi:hypothetical protein